MRTIRDRRSLLLPAALLILAAVLGGCTDDNDTPCGDVEFNGFVETDEDGNILSGGDLGHWCLPGDEDPPTEPAFGPAYPNPFNNAVSLEFTLPEPNDVKIEIYNRRCDLLRTLVDGRMPAGRHVVAWDGTDYRSARVTDGYYAAAIVVGADEWECWGVLYLSTVPVE